MDGGNLQIPGPLRRRHLSRPGRPRAPGGLCLRRDLRHQQRTRLRLPSRQHEIQPRRHGAAAVFLRHRRRSRLHPDRRGAHAPDHLRPDRGLHRPLRRHRQADPQTRARGLREGREGPRRDPDRGRHRKDGAVAEGHRADHRGQSLRPRQLRRCAPISCSRGTRTTSSRTTRSSSSTNSPGA